MRIDQSAASIWASVAKAGKAGDGALGDLSALLGAGAQPAKPAYPAANSAELWLRVGAQTALDAQLAGQRQEAPQTATDKFLEYARMSPAERLREDILKALGVTEEELAALAPDERAAMEKKIRELIEEKMREAMGAEESDRAGTGLEQVDIVA